MKRFIIIALLLITLPLYSIEIRLNGQLFQYYSAEDLENLSYRLPDYDSTGLYLYEILPIMDEVHEFRLISENFTLETNPSRSLAIVTDGQSFSLQSDEIGKILLPSIIEINGIKNNKDMFTIWFDRKDADAERELELFAALHGIKAEFRTEENIISLLEHNSADSTKIPDLIIYNSSKENRMAPLLKPVEAWIGEYRGFQAFWKKSIPFKFTRQVFMSLPVVPDAMRLVADFGDLDIIYPLFVHFGFNGERDDRREAVIKTFQYLKTLYNKGIYTISDNAEQELLSGRANGIYGDSMIFGKIDELKEWHKDLALPLLESANQPPPLISYTLLAVPAGSDDENISRELLSYLTDPGVQQRINPGQGFMPADSRALALIPETTEKQWLLSDLDRATTIPSGETYDRMRFALPRIYRLVVTNRLTVNEGVDELFSFIED